MKLRNKKTGEVTEEVYVVYDGLKIGDDLSDNSRLYKSLEELEEDWEDYKPIEPLIKEEKIRKAIRAWAEALDLRWFKRCSSVNAHTSRLYGQDAKGTGYTMELGPNDLYGDSISKKGYTLAELCGEEE